MPFVQLGWGLKCLEYNQQLFESQPSPQLCFLWPLLECYLHHEACFCAWSFILRKIQSAVETKAMSKQPVSSVKPYWRKDGVIASSSTFSKLPLPLLCLFPRKCQAEFFSIKWEMRSDCYKNCWIGLFVYLFSRETTPSNSPFCRFMLGCLKSHFYIY